MFIAVGFGKSIPAGLVVGVDCELCFSRKSSLRARETARSLFLALNKRRRGKQLKEGKYQRVSHLKTNRITKNTSCLANEQTKGRMDGVMDKHRNE